MDETFVGIDISLLIAADVVDNIISSSDTKLFSGKILVGMTRKSQSIVRTIVSGVK